MSDNWDFYFCQVDSEPASIFVDLGIREEVPIAGLPDLAWLRLYMQKPREDGLSSNAEYETLAAIEDSLSDAMESAHVRLQYVGRNTSGGCRDFYVYAEDGEKAIEAFQNAMRPFPKYECELGTRKDASWQAYTSFLFPNDRERQMIENGRVLTVLQEHGDDHSIVRPVCHWAYFRSEHQRSAFVDDVSVAGFEIKGQSDSQDNGAHPYGISFARPSAVDYVSIHSEVLDVFDRVARYDGDYDGWETSVEKTRA